MDERNNQQFKKSFENQPIDNPNVENQQPENRQVEAANEMQGVATKKSFSKKKIAIGTTLSLILFAAIFVLVMALKSPALYDEQSGITVSVPSDSVSLFQKVGLKLLVEEQKKATPVYEETKELLAPIGGNLVLYDFELIKNGKEVEFDGNVTVSTPIPEGFNPATVKIYHVADDNTYEEVASVVSEDGRTVSFEVSHFSYYALIQTHNVVTDAAKSSTCTETGLTEGSHCSTCGQILDAQHVVPATGHTYATTVTAPTCVEIGYTTYICHCGDTYTADEVAALGHTEVTDAAVDATCTTDGKTEGSHCSVCNEVLVAQENIPATGHNYKSVVTAPTCVEIGYTTYICHCGDTYTADEVAALGHTEATDAAVDATCTTDGKTEGKHCSVCNEVLVAQETIPATGHNYKSVVTAPTCVEIGYTTYICHCGDTYTADEVAALGHTEVTDAAIDATCTTDGKTEGSHCSICGQILNAQRVVPATGHTEVTDAAIDVTCTTDGKTEGKHCSVCNEVLVAQKTVDATGHSYSFEVLPPTDTESVCIVYTCAGCRDTYSDYVSYTGMQYDDHFTHIGNIQATSATVTFAGDACLEIVTKDNTKYFRANNIGIAIVTDGDVTEIVVITKAQLHLVVVMGQSNAGCHFDNVLSDVTCKIGTAYWWGNQGADTTTPIDYAMPSTGLHLPLVAELYAQSAAAGNPEKPVLIWAEGVTSKNGKPITAWVTSKDDTSGTDATVKMITDCINYYTAAEHVDFYEIVESGVYWLQGEAGADPVQYTDCFMTVWGRLKDAGINYCAFFRVRQDVSDNKLIDDHNDLTHRGTLRAQMEMVNQYEDMYFATDITENWYGVLGTEHSIDISNYLSMLEFYGNSETYSDEFGNKATFKDGILTTSMFELYGENNYCHYGKFGYGIIGADAAYNIYRALHGEDYAIVYSDTTGLVHNQISAKPGETHSIHLEDISGMLTFRPDCFSTSGTLNIKVTSDNIDITAATGVISQEQNTYMAIDKDTIATYSNVTITVTYTTASGESGSVVFNIVNESILG